jgi:hypothetical protein
MQSKPPPKEVGDNLQMSICRKQFSSLEVEIVPNELRTVYSAKFVVRKLVYFNNNALV